MWKRVVGTKGRCSVWKEISFLNINYCNFEFFFNLQAVCQSYNEPKSIFGRDKNRKSHLATSIVKK